MKIRRSRFVIGLGAFATAGVFRAVPAAAQVVPPRGELVFPPRRTQRDLGNQGALYQFSVDVGGGERVFVTAAVLPRQSFAARIVQQTTRLNALDAVQNIARNSAAAVAINGGQFNGAFAPEGLLIVDGEVIGRKRADWIGYLTIDADGNAAVTDKPDLRRARYALQGDPLMIEPSNKMGMIRDDNRRARRSVIAQSGDLIIALVTSPVTLFDLAYALMENPGHLFLTRIDAALNLSGAATTSFYARLKDGGEVTVPARWPNRSAITFSPRPAVHYT